MQVHQQVQVFDGVRNCVKLKTESSVQTLNLSDTALDALKQHKALTTRMRTAAGTLLYANDVGIETIRRVLGNSSVGLTSRIYVHNAEKPLRGAAESMNNFE